MKTENTHTMKHTPTPWEVTGELDYIRISNTDSKNPDSCDGIRQVAHVVQGDYEIPNYEEAMANAQHIIHCVNTHAELLEALKECVADAEKAVNPESRMYGYAKARAAIAKATKEGK